MTEDWGGYVSLQASDLTEIRARRVRSLEMDHVVACLALEEDPTDERARADAIELVRRIRLHRAKLQPPAVETAEETPSEELEEPGP